MASQYQMEQAAEIARFVVENGRVESDGEGNSDQESLRGEVEFECEERSLEDCAEIADLAVQFA